VDLGTSRTKTVKHKYHPYECLYRLKFHGHATLCNTQANLSLKQLLVAADPSTLLQTAELRRPQHPKRQMRLSGQFG